MWDGNRLGNGEDLIPFTKSVESGTFTAWGEGLDPLRQLIVSCGRHQYVIVLKIYLDETGHVKDPNAPIVGMAGCIASLSAWEQFESEWTTALQDFGVTELHMKHFAHFRGEFSGWTEDRRQQLLARLLPIIEMRIDTWVGALLPISQFTELSDEQKLRLRDPYFICLQDCLHAAIIFVDSNYPRENLEVVVAMHEEYAWDSYGCVIGCAHQLPGGERIESVTAASPKKVRPLQAADLLAYELTKMGKLMMRPERKPLRYPMEQLKNKCAHVEFYLDKPLSQRV